MDRQALTRRDFLRISALSLGALAFKPVDWPDGLDLLRPRGRVRVGTSYIYRYREPDYKSEKLGVLRRDEMPIIYEEIISPKGPPRNPRWYRLSDGFIHSGHVQRLDGVHLNRPLDTIPEGGRLGEITVPFAQSMRSTTTLGWTKLYRLYFHSVFWITGLDPGPDGKPWYRLTDDLLHVHYWVPATSIRPIEPSELAPISPDVPMQDKWIDISIQDQTLTAYEGDQVVLHTQVSTGIPSSRPTPNGIPTATPSGHFHVEVKVPSRHMGDANLTSDPEAYELPGVPWVSFFHITGVAMHGTYWHDNFGSMMSHGCVNMRNADARWIYRWSLPTAEPQDWDRKGHGTYVRVA